MARLLRIVALVACAIVVVGFVAFASDEAGRGSDKQLQALDRNLNEPAPSAAAERAREKRHGQPRELIDDANDALLAPFTGIVDTNDVWVRRLVPSVLALLVYGLGLTLVANFLPRRSDPAGDWRTAT